MRVLITGMGGELGTRVAGRLEGDERVAAVLGIDTDPPRRRLRRAEFHLVDPLARRRFADVVREFDPTVVVHLGVYEPNARVGPAAARELSEATAIAALGAAATCRSLERIVVRSGIEVYGRRRGTPTKPDEDVVPDPTSPFGEMLLAHRAGGGLRRSLGRRARHGAAVRADRRVAPRQPARALPAAAGRAGEPGVGPAVLAAARRGRGARPSWRPSTPATTDR